jgi:hypothetical protein
MPAAAAIPGIIGAVGAGATAAGSIYGAVKGQASPEAVFPQMQGQYLSSIGQGLGPESASTLNQFARTGMPSNVGPMFEALVNSQQRFAEQGRGNILEQFGGMGMRYSKPALDAVVDYESQLSSSYGNILAQYTFQALEAAKQRQMQASGLGLQAWSQPALTLQGQQQPGMGMANMGLGLMGLGQYLGALR